MAEFNEYRDKDGKVIKYEVFYADESLETNDSNVIVDPTIADLKLQDQLKK